MVKAILSMKDRLYQHGFIVHDDGENVNFSHVKTKNAAEKIGGGKRIKRIRIRKALRPA